MFKKCVTADSKECYLRVYYTFAMRTTTLLQLSFPPFIILFMIFFLLLLTGLFGAWHPE